MADDFNILDSGPGLALVPAYTVYTPTLTASAVNPTMGTGATSYGYYGQVGKRTFGYAGVTFGTSAAAGTGNYGFLLPFEPVNRVQPIGTGYVQDSSDFGRVVLCAVAVVPSLFASSTRKAVLIQNNAAASGFNNGNNPVGASVPFIWADADNVTIQFDYEAL